MGKSDFCHFVTGPRAGPAACSQRPAHPSSHRALRVTSFQPQQRWGRVVIREAAWQPLKARPPWSRSRPQAKAGHRSPHDRSPDWPPLHPGFHTRGGDTEPRTAAGVSSARAGLTRQAGASTATTPPPNEERVTVTPTTAGPWVGGVGRPQTVRLRTPRPGPPAHTARVEAPPPSAPGPFICTCVCTKEFCFQVSERI